MTSTNRILVKNFTGGFLFLPCPAEDLERQTAPSALPHLRSAAASLVPAPKSLLENGESLQLCAFWQMFVGSLLITSNLSVPVSIAAVFQCTCIMASCLGSSVEGRGRETAEPSEGPLGWLGLGRRDWKRCFAHPGRQGGGDWNPPCMARGGYMDPARAGDIAATRETGCTQRWGSSPWERRSPGTGPREVVGPPSAKLNSKATL